MFKPESFQNNPQERVEILGEDVQKLIEEEVERGKQYTQEESDRRINQIARERDRAKIREVREKIDKIESNPDDELFDQVGSLHKKTMEISDKFSRAFAEATEREFKEKPSFGERIKRWFSRN